MPKWLAFSSRASSDAVSLPGSFCCAKTPFSNCRGNLRRGGQRHVGVASKVGAWIASVPLRFFTASSGSQR